MLVVYFQSFWEQKLQFEAFEQKMCENAQQMLQVQNSVQEFWYAIRKKFFLFEFVIPSVH